MTRNDCPRVFIRLSIFALLFFVSLNGRAGFAETSEGKIYRRIISLTPSTTEILFSLGLDEEIVGVTTYCRHPAKALTKPKVGGYVKHNLEAILEQKPDLVVLSANRGTKFIYDQLNQVGVESLAVDLYSLSDLIKAYRIIGAKLGKEKEAQAWVAQFERNIAELQAASVSQPLKVAYVNWHYPLMLAGGSSLEGDILRLMGIKNVAEKSPSRYPKWNIEALLATDPDLIIDAQMYADQLTWEKQKQTVRKFWSAYPNITAVKQGEIYIYQTDLANVPGPRTLELIKALREIFTLPRPKESSDYYEKIRA